MTKPHPLVHSNESDLTGQKYQSIFTGMESFLEDHKVKGEKILPGVAYLELARQAGERSLRRPITQLKDVTWLHPIHINGTLKQIRIRISEEAEVIGYEIYSERGETIYSKGRLTTETHSLQSSSYDIAKIKDRLPDYKSGNACYSLFKEQGVDYGSSLRGMEILYYSEKEALSRITLPIHEDYVLQPGFLDSALQTCAGLNFGEKNSIGFPFSVEEVNIYGDISKTRWCYARKSANNKVGGKVINYDIDMLSEIGEVLLSFKSFAALPLDEHSRTDSETPQPSRPLSMALKETKSLYYKPVWKLVSISEETSSLDGKHGLTMIVGQKNILAKQLKSIIESSGGQVTITETLDHIPSEVQSVYLLQGFDTISQEQEATDQIGKQELSVFRSIKVLQSKRFARLNLTVLTRNTQTVYNTESIQASGSGIIGLIGSLAKEMPGWNVRIVDVDQHDKTVSNKLLSIPFLKNGSLQVLRAGSLFRTALIPLRQPVSLLNKSKFRKSGVYVILGGAGGIGRTTTEYLIRNYGARVYWLGRRKADEKIASAIAELSQYGPAPVYIQCDATVRSDVEAAYKQIKQNEKEVHGLFHSAIVLNDMMLSNMGAQDFKKAFDPKSLSSHHLVDTFKEEHLDFVCFYSSVLSYLSAPGQSNYSAGCTYKDSYARKVEKELGIPSYTVNWGYWGEVGAVSSSGYNEQMTKMGIGSITAGEGMSALEVLLSGENRQLSINKLIGDEGFKHLFFIDLEEEICYQETSSVIELEKVTLLPLSINEKEAADFQDICHKGIVQILIDLGIEEQAGEAINILRQRLHIMDKYDRLFHELVRSLSVHKYLSVESNKVILSQEIKNDLKTFDLSKALHEITERNPDYEAYSKLLEACLKSFKSILKGELKATDIIFPSGSMYLVSGIYKDNQEVDYFNNALCDLVKTSIASSIAQLKEGEQFTILEVGAGTGGTSARLFDALQAYGTHIRYIYTDLSKSFLMHAEKTYGSIAPYMETTLFNIETSPEKQGIALGSCDMIIGTNVVHATKDIAVSLQNIKAVLKKRGVLLLNEIVTIDIFNTLTFGLLDGWWTYEDEDLRLEGSPLLSGHSWNKVLTKTGFTDIMKYPEQQQLSQQILVAQSDGEIRINRSPQKTQYQKTKSNVSAPLRLKKDRNWLSNSLIDIASKTIKLSKEEFDIDEQFSDFGFDSILGNQLVSNINEELNISLNPTDIFNYPNIKTLTEYISEHFEIYTTEPAEESIPEEKTSTHQTKKDRNWLSNSLIDITSKTIKLSKEEFDIDEQFSDFGFDSILGNQLVSNINEELNITLNPTDIFNYPNIKTLTEYILENFEVYISQPTVESISEEKNSIEQKEIAQPLPVLRRDRHGIKDKISSETIKNDRTTTIDIAIVGMSGQYGSAKDLDTFWTALSRGESLIEEVPKDRWDISEHYSIDKEANNKTYSKWGSFLKDIDKFDPMFFKISGLEAENTDPQQRLFLEHCWKAFEDAGIPPQMLNGVKCGIYVGAAKGDYVENPSSKDASVFWGSHSSILAARISYFLNLKGPAIAIDTACSSSLVAIDMACKSLQLGDTDIAISGGVTIKTTSEFYKLASKAGMLSEDGQCYTFDHRANGFVPGEGVGVLVLKRLEDAEQAGDHIYGVIKGTATNQDGTSNGILAPSANSQEQLEKEVYETYEINPGTISYVEAHGTGTRLGDPIEFRALTNAFRSKTDKVQYCGLGSVKTNIGHTLMAAGVAGVQKVLLSMKHKALPPSLNFEKVNPLLNVEESPFYFNTQLKDWKTEDNQPRRAAVSSFGFSGTNAHAVIEEYNQPKKTYHSQDPAIILLSARNAAQLKEQVSNLNDFIDLYPDLSLYDIAYTLQIGRTFMTERIAIVVNDLKELSAALARYLQGVTTGFLNGSVNKDNSDFLLEGEAGRSYIETAIRVKESGSLAQLWVKGVSVDWNLLYEKDNRPNKISLPAYPFARERYWISSQETKPIVERMLHPLLHSNESDLNEQKYASIYTGKESFLSNHRINGEKVLPGVAYLELARVAGSLSTRSSITQLKDITWQSPIFIHNNPEQVQTRIYVSDGEIGYEVYTWSSKNTSTGKAEKQVHSEGKLMTQVLPSPINYNQKELSKQFTNYKDKEAFYDLFKDMGLNLGSSFRGIEKIGYSRTAALSKIILPKEEDYVLSPGIMDSALQTCMGLRLDEGIVSLALPFSIKELNIYGALPETVWSYARRSANYNANAKVFAYDIDILNDEGKVLVSLKDFIALPIKNSQEPVITTGKAPITHFYSNDWLSSPDILPGKACDSQLVLIAGGSVVLADRLKEELELEVIAIAEETEEACFQKILEKVRDSLRGNTPVNITLVCEQTAYLHYGFVSGLLKTAHQENPEVTGKIIVVEHLSIQNFPTLTTILTAEQGNSDPEVRYINGKRESKVIMPVSSSSIAVKDSPKIKTGGVYLITGGAGGLGKIFASHISNTQDTKIILTGRSVLTKEKERLLSSLSNMVYYTCDVSIREEVSALIDKVKEKYGKLDGIIHSAAVLQDSRIVDKTPEEVREVFAPKILGAKHLDEATKGEALDFMIFFSSMTSVIGNIGQCDYASANAYLDNYASYREKKRLNGERQGKTLSINWSLWKDGGMQLDKEVLQYIENQWGMMPLPVTEGIKAFDELLGSTRSQMAVVFGDEHEIAEKLLEKPQKLDTKNMNSGDPLLLKEQLTTGLLELIADMLKIDVHKISTHKALGDYGFDSIRMTAFTNKLNKHYQIDLMPTVFYNYPTIETLTAHLLEGYSGALSKHYTTILKEKISVPDSGIKEYEVPPRKSRFAIPENNIRADKEDISKNNLEGIAIIGISARFPGSPDLNTFWENLCDNKDLITEIPSFRWDWKKYYGDAKTEKGKTKAKWGGFIEDIDKFDPLFFNISPREAALMDPQQRITLEAVYHAIEDAAIPVEKLKGSNTGAFIGVSTNDYFSLLCKDPEISSQAQFSTGQSHSVLANRISYLLDIHGPSEPIDTACSSALIAVHRAAEHIRNGHCNIAIAGGVNALLSPEVTLSFSQAGMLSEDGRCKTFDKDANGYVRGEGVGIVILKSLSKAEEDGDHIYGIIRGTAENHGGKANTLTSPNPDAQKGVLLSAIRSSRVDPRAIGYIEAHGTGTPLGDAIETEALKMAFKELYNDTNLSPSEHPYCGIGSVKTNIGHLEAAAGIAGVMKVVLSFQHKMLPGNTNLKTPNEYLKLDGSPFYLLKETKEWIARDNKPRIAGVSSFGFGGSNAHIILEEYIPKEKEPYRPTAPAVIVLSAKNEDRLEAQVANLNACLKDNKGMDLYDLAYTLQIGRTLMEERLAFVVSDLEELSTRLTAYLEGKPDNFLRGNVKNDTADLLSKREADYIRTAISNQQVEVLAQFWVKGITVDWKLLYEGVALPNKISLPGYPFTRKHCWFMTPPGNSVKKVKPPKPSLTLNTKGLQLVQSTKSKNSFQGELRKITAPEGLSVPLQHSERQTQITQELKKYLCDFLYLDTNELGVGRPFNELGLDSILGVEWIKWINNTYQLDIKIPVLYDYPTVKKLAEYIAAKKHESGSQSTPPSEKKASNFKHGMTLLSPEETNAVVPDSSDKKNEQHLKIRLSPTDDSKFT